MKAFFFPLGVCWRTAHQVFEKLFKGLPFFLQTKIYNKLLPMDNFFQVLKLQVSCLSFFLHSVNDDDDVDEYNENNIVNNEEHSRDTIVYWR